MAQPYKGLAWKGDSLEFDAQTPQWEERTSSQKSSSDLWAACHTHTQTQK